MSDTLLILHIDCRPRTGSGTTAVVGAVGDGDGGLASGSAYVFELPGGLASLADTLTNLLATISDPGAAAAVQDAIDSIIGANGGRANNGVLDKLDAGDPNAAMGKIRDAIQAFQAAELADPMLDLTDAKTTLAEAAYDVALEKVDEADFVASSKGELKQVLKAMDALADGDVRLGMGDFPGAVDEYQTALQKALGVL
jgi:hypothetical protein